MKKFRRTRTRLQTSAITLVASALVAGVALVAVGLAQSPASAVPTPGISFTVNSMISSSSVSQTPASLYPGVQRYYWYTVTNLLTVPITVTSLSIKSVTPPTTCDLSNLNYANTAYTTAFVLQPGHPITVSEPISLNDLPTSQNNTHSSTENCAGQTFAFTNTGTAFYTEATTTALTSSPNPSTSGNTVTFTATVTANNASYDLSPPSLLGGTVNFYSCPTPSQCTAATPWTLLGSGTIGTGGVATFATYSLPVGNSYVEAVYPTSGTDFLGSTSNVVTQPVGAAIGGASCLIISTTGATVIRGTYSGNYEVKNGTTLWLNGGTITGNVSVDATGKFVGNGGKVGGNLASSGGTVSLQGTSVVGNLQTTNAAVGLGAGTHVGGSVQVTGGTIFCSAGTASSTVQIGSSLQIQSLGTSANPVTICSTQVAGSFTYQSNATPVVIGGSAACLGNTISGSFTVQSNSAKVTIGAIGSGFGNTVKGSITVQKNTGGGTLTSNASTGGSCTLSGDKPGIVGSLNTSAGKNTCNATA